MQMAQGFSIIALVFWVIFILGSIAAGVFFIIAAWKAMRAHESIAGSMKEIAEALQAQTRAEIFTSEHKEQN